MVPVGIDIASEEETRVIDGNRKRRLYGVAREFCVRGVTGSGDSHIARESCYHAVDTVRTFEDSILVCEHRDDLGVIEQDSAFSRGRKLRKRERDVVREKEREKEKEIEYRKEDGLLVLPLLPTLKSTRPIDRDRLTHLSQSSDSRSSVSLSFSLLLHLSRTPSIVKYFRSTRCVK